MTNWRPVVLGGSPALYAVSDAGDVFSWRAGRIMSPSLNNAGYYRLSLRADGRTYESAIHRLVAIAFLGSPLPGYEVNHRNGDRTDNRVVNLEFCTKTENIRHAFHVLGRHGPRGAKSARAILTDDSVREIRQRYDIGGATFASLAADYSVSRSAIAGIIKRSRWKHVQ